jgi:dTDP-4-dehydrorhamnose 3,5-epimerase
MNKRFSFHDLPLTGLFRIAHKPITDNRGCFSRLFCSEDFRPIGFDNPIAQLNFSQTDKKGTIRGMHFQYPPSSEDKIVTCIRGKVFDVAVDIRKNSPTFLQWHGEVLSSENQTSLLIPKGFAHGFQTMVGDCQLLYAHSELYTSGSEGALNPLDPKLAINWPNQVMNVSKRDSDHPWLDQTFSGLDLP